ncbi:MAG: c-type cytochrome domain-containing protein, partial [Planctomycetaceae bacterium]
MYQPHSRTGLLFWLTGILSLSSLAAPLQADESQPALTFDRDILPIFRDKCIRCHAGVEPKASLNLTSPSSLLNGGKSGPALRIGAAEFSLLYEKVASGSMPPVGQQLTAAEKGRLRKWINDGAAGISSADAGALDEAFTAVEHWAFRPPERPAVPQQPSSKQPLHPVDAFILQRLQQHNLTMSPPADRLTLL